MHHIHQFLTGDELLPQQNRAAAAAAAAAANRITPGSLVQKRSSFR
jgi:hypothetical protein